MAYNWHFSAATALFLAMLASAYLRQRRIPNLTNKLVSGMLVTAALAALLDALSAAAEPVAAAWPVALLYLVNMGFLACLHLCLPMYCFFTLLSTGRYASLRRAQKLLLLAPCALVGLLLLISPVCELGIFYIDANHAYRHGATHSALYVVSGFYLGVGLLTVLVRRRSLPRVKRLAVYFFTAALGGMIALQILYPNYLLTTTAAGVGLFAIYHLLQSPDEFIDPATEAFNRASLPSIIAMYNRRGAPYVLMVFTLRDGSSLENALGMRVAGGLLRELVNRLQAVCPRSPVLRVDDYALAVFGERGSDPADTLERLPDEWRVYGSVIRTGVWAFAVDSATTESVMEVMDYLLQLPAPPESAPVRWAGAATLSAFSKEIEARRAFRGALRADGLAMEYQPMVRESGEVWALEALPRARDGALSDCDSNELLRLAALEGDGVSVWLDGFRQACEVACAGHRVVYRLSAAVCLRQEIARRIALLLAQTGAEPGRIVFSLVEAELAQYEAGMEPTLRALVDLGFFFLMDDFGVSNANFNAITRLPFLCVRIGGSLFDDALVDSSQRALLDGIRKVIDDIHIESACAQIDTPERAAMLRELPVGIRQGACVAEALQSAADKVRPLPSQAAR